MSRRRLDPDEAAWYFETARYLVTLHVEPEEMDPAESFQFDEDVEAVRSGAVEWFCAVVTVWEWDAGAEEWCELTGDSLGGCAYKTVREFYTAHRGPDPMDRNSSIMRAARGDNVCICHYFPSMVTEAVGLAKEMLNLRWSLAARAIEAERPDMYPDI